MKRTLIAAATAAVIGLGMTFSASAMPIGKIAPAATSDDSLIQVRGGHGHGRGHMGRGGRGHHYGWSRGRHRGWR